MKRTCTEAGGMPRILAAATIAIFVALVSRVEASELLADATLPDGSPLCDECHCCGCECCDFECCDSFNGRRRILGMLPSDHCFDRFVSPLSNPFFFEDPRSLTEARGIFLENSLPNPVGSGDVQVWAAQFRGRLTDRLSVIAPRVGYLQVNDQGGPSGFPSAPVGVKYNFVRDVEAQLLVSAGITYFIPENLSNFPLPSDGDFHFFLTAGKEIFGYGHWLSATGFRIPADNNWGTQLWYWSNQWDYEVVDHWYGLFGVNWFHWLRSAGANVGSSVTGLDLVNVPAGGVAGSDVVTCLVGLKWKPSRHLEVGSGFEFPLTDREDILRNRLYVDAIFRY
jgi:hypothetical protein